MILDRYIGKSIIVGCMLATFVMLSIFMFVDFVAQLSYVGTGDYGNMQAVLYVLMRLPQRLYELAPSILLLGGILSLGAMAANSELIVMRASGVSTLRITRSVLQAGMLLAVLVVVLGEFIAPEAARTAKTYRAEALEKKLIVGGSSDLWARDGNRYVNVKRVLPDQQLRDVMLFEIDVDRRLKQIVHASNAQYVGDRWQLEDVSGTLFADGSTSTVYHETLEMDRLILLELFSVLELETHDMSASELYSYSDYLDTNSLDNDEYMLAFWIKVFTPFTCLAMLLIAMPIVFATTPRSGGAGQRVIIAVLIGVVYFVINRSVNHLGLALDVKPLLSAALPLLLVTAISVYFLRRVQ